MSAAAAGAAVGPAGTAAKDPGSVHIVSWNAAGWAKALKRIVAQHGGLAQWLDRHGVDVLCVQEVKLSAQKLGETPKEFAANIPGWQSYWACPRTSLPGTAAAASRPQLVAGVATFAREGLVRAADASALGEEELDAEGRCLVTDHGDHLVFNVYVPNAGSTLGRLPFAVRFLRRLRARMTAARAQGYKVVLAGDLNIIRRGADVVWRERCVCLDELAQLCDDADVDQDEGRWLQVLWRSWVDILQPALATLDARSLSGKASGKSAARKWVVSCRHPATGEQRSFGSCQFDSEEEARTAFRLEERVVPGEREEALVVQRANTLQVRRIMCVCEAVLSGAARDTLVSCGDGPWRALADRLGRSRSSAVLRDWLDALVAEDSMVDTFSCIHPAAMERFTVWDQYRQERFYNEGARIDYILVDGSLMGRVLASIGGDATGERGLPLGSRWPPNRDISGRNFPPQFVRSHLSPPDGEGIAESAREALLCGTANGNWTPVPFSGGGLEQPSAVEDAMQFRKGPGTGMIYTPPIYSDHIPVTALLASSEAVLATSRLPQGATARAQPHLRTRTLAAYARAGTAATGSAACAAAPPAAPAAPAARTNVLTSQMLPVAEAAAAAAPCGSPSISAASASRLLASDRCIAALDLDCYYAQCEELRRPELKGKPIGVQQKMLVITSNYAARAFGVQKGESVTSVRQKCPDITICNGEDLAFYREVSQRIFDLAISRAPRVEKLGMDEIFVDITDSVTERLAALLPKGEPIPALQGFQYGAAASPASPQPQVVGNIDALSSEERCRVRLAVASQIVAELRATLLSELGLTSSAGVSVSKLLAKMVASEHKPNKQTVFVPTATGLSALLPDSLPIQKLPGVGFSATRKWNDLGVCSIGDLLAASSHVDGGAAAQRPEIANLFDAKTLLAQRTLCLGLCEAEVKTSGPPKGCSTEDSFWQKPIHTDAAVLESFGQLARRLLVKIRGDEARFGCRAVATLAVSLRHAPANRGLAPGAVPNAEGGRERKQMRLDGSMLRIASQPSEKPPREPSELSAADELKAKAIVERAFGLFRKLVPNEPFALHILNLHIQYDEPLDVAQTRLSFGKSSSASASAPAPKRSLPITTVSSPTSPPLKRSRTSAAESPSKVMHAGPATATAVGAAAVSLADSPQRVPGATAAGTKAGTLLGADNFFATSRLSFIGSWRSHFRRFARELLAPGGHGVACKDAELEAALQAIQLEAGSTWPGAVYMHVDADCFFCSVALLERPELVGRAVAVVSGRADTSEVCSASYEARASGLHANMFVREALSRCPQLELIPTSAALFQKVTEASREIYGLLFQITEAIEPLSCDELYVQFLPGTCKYPPEALARCIRAHILRRTRCSVSVGVGHSSTVARWATRKAKPPDGTGVYVLPTERAEEELAACPTKTLSGIGAATSARLEAMGARTCGEARCLAMAQLQREFGDTLGQQIFAMVRGEEPKGRAPFSVRRILAELPQTIQSALNWGVRPSSREDADKLIRDVCEHLAGRLKDEALEARTLRLLVKKRVPGAPEPTKQGGFGLCEDWSRSGRLTTTAADAGILASTATRLLDAFDAPATEIRGLSISLSKLEHMRGTWASELAGKSGIKHWLQATPVAQGDAAGSNGRAEVPDKRPRIHQPPDTAAISLCDDLEELHHEPHAVATRKYDEQVAALVGMGFAAGPARECLQATGGDVAAAVDRLLAVKHPTSTAIPLLSTSAGGNPAVSPRDVAREATPMKAVATPSATRTGTNAARTSVRQPLSGLAAFFGKTGASPDKSQRQQAQQQHMVAPGVSSSTECVPAINAHILDAEEVSTDDEGAVVID